MLIAVVGIWLLARCRTLLEEISNQAHLNTQRLGAILDKELETKIHLVSVANTIDKIADDAHQNVKSMENVIDDINNIERSVNSLEGMYMQVHNFKDVGEALANMKAKRWKAPPCS